MYLPRLVISGVHSGVGKTTVATALMRALTGSGLNVQPFKVGPDYIDPGYHTAATGHNSRNLDPWLLGEDGVREMFIRSATGADISIIEGVMGLYDGRGSGDEGSTAHVARLLNAPVVLVLDARSMARSAAAMVLGYKKFDPEINLCAVILNNIKSERHFLFLKEAIQQSTGMPVLGRVEYESAMKMPERYLGLLPTAEKSNLNELLDLMAYKIRRGLDLEGLVKLASTAPFLAPPGKRIFPEVPREPVARMGIVFDGAFNFYYRDGLDLLAALGVEIVSCSAIRDKFPSNLDGLYIGGGFPEMFAEGIAQNLEFMDGIRKGFGHGMPIYAECGGMMYLSEVLTDLGGRNYPMVGIVPGQTVMQKKRSSLGYVSAVALQDSILAPAGSNIRGHEFHYSELRSCNQYDHAYLLKKEGEDSSRSDGCVNGSLLASYMHIHFAGCFREALNLVSACQGYRRKRKRR